MQLTKWVREPKWIWISKVMVIQWPWSKVTQIHFFKLFFKLFSLETARPIEAKFHVEPLIYSNGPGHMTNMAAMPIYGNNLKKSSSLELKGWWPWNLVWSIGYSSTTKFIQRRPWVDLDLFYSKVRFGPFCFSMGKMVKWWIFQKLL